MMLRRSRGNAAWVAPVLTLILTGAVEGGCSGDSGQTATGGTSTGNGGSSTASTTGGAGGTGGEGGDGGSTVVSPKCFSPSGYQVCGGSNQCPFAKDVCPACIPSNGDEKGIIALCQNETFVKYQKSIGADHSGCGFCVDESACFDLFDVGFGDVCVPFEFAALVAESGAPERVRYADHSLWTGESLPEPASCPTLVDVPICGGACGTCANGSAACTGRSPLHPYGICLSDETIALGYCNSEWPCEGGFGCFRWKVQPEAQAEADDSGICLPLATCKAAAVNLPGGGFCAEP